MPVFGPAPSTMSLGVLVGSSREAPLARRLGGGAGGGGGGGGGGDDRSRVACHGAALPRVRQREVRAQSRQRLDTSVGVGPRTLSETEGRPQTSDTQTRTGKTLTASDPHIRPPPTNPNHASHK